MSCTFETYFRVFILHLEITWVKWSHHRLWECTLPAWSEVIIKVIIILSIWSCVFCLLRTLSFNTFAKLLVSCLFFVLVSKSFTLPFTTEHIANSFRKNVETEQACHYRIESPNRRWQKRNLQRISESNTSVTLHSSQFTNFVLCSVACLFFSDLIMKLRHALNVWTFHLSLSILVFLFI